jgi:hypothetical protein
MLLNVGLGMKRILLLCSCFLELSKNNVVTITCGKTTWIGMQVSCPDKRMAVLDEHVMTLELKEKM